MTTTQKTRSGSSRAHSPEPLGFLKLDALLSDEEGGMLTGIQAFRQKEAARRSKQKKMTKKRHKTLPNLLKELASEHGGETALICDGETLAFGELEERSRYLAGGLARLGIVARVGRWR